MSDTYTPRVNESILQGLRALTDQSIAEQTAAAMDYTPAELDDLVGRKVEEAPFSGDAMARTIRARRGTARATGETDPFKRVNVAASTNLWGSAAGSRTRRMAAVGFTDGVGNTEVHHAPNGKVAAFHL